MMTTTKSHSSAYRCLTLFMSLLMALQPPMAYAQVVAASVGNRPVVDTAANGVPVIQIVAPNRAGVSHNQYQHYNVGQQGLILNNSGNIINTQQAGYITGNPNLTGGGAKIILNEVTGNLPSQLRGTTEVAGSRAEVILANPNGIVCEGCGFINTSRSVLTTGTPVFGGDGSLAAYRVRGGQINIEGAGLDGRNLDQLDLIARSIVLRGSVWSGDNLNIIAGANQVSHESLTATPIAGEGTAPTWGIDTALTGGMYGQKIRLLVTEAGVGVRHAGTLVAQSGDFQLDAAGQITLTGKVDASGHINIQTSANLDNSGTVYGSNTLNISSGGQINNTGLLAAVGDIRLAAISLDSSGNLAAGVDRDGNVTQSSSLTATTTGILKATGQNLAGNSLWFEGAQLQLSGAKTSAQGSITLKASQGSIDHTGGILQSGSDLILNSTGRLINDAAQLNAGGQLALTIAGLSNRGGQIAQIGTAQNGRIQSSGDLDNQGGSIISNASLTLQAAQFDNQGGKVQVQNDADLDMQLTGTLDNRNNGQIAATGTAQLEAETLLNTGGSITAGQDLITTTLQQIDNHQGTLAALKNVELTAGELNNQAGVIASVEGDTDIALYGGTLSNTLNNTQGNISAGQDLSLDALSVINQGGTLYAKQDVSLFADQYSGNGILLANRDMSILLLGDYTQSATNLIQANRHLDFWLSGDLINEGTLGAVGTLTLDANRIDNRAGALLQGDTTELWATQINNAGTLIGNTLSTDSITFSNTGRVFGQDIQINADALGNQGTGVIAAGNTLNLYIATLLDNLDGALLYSMGNLSIAASSERDDAGRLKDFTLSVLNSSADIQAEGDLEISALVLDNRRTDIVTDTRTLSSSTTLVQEWDNDWAASEIGETYINSPTVKQVIVTEVCSAGIGQFCQTSTETRQVSNNLYLSLSGSSLGTVTTAPVQTCSDSGCQWTTITTTTTLINPYGAEEWNLPEASDLSTFNILDLQRGGRRYVQQNTDTQEYIVSATPEARILAGRNLYLNAGIVNNEASRIEATGSLIADVGVLNNVGVTLSNKIRETLWIGKCSDIKDSVAGVLGYCGHGWIWTSEINDTLTGTHQSLDATFIGNQNLSLDAVIVDNHTVNAQGLPPGGINLTVDSTAYTPSPYIFTLPGNGLYTVRPDPASRYLIETDPRFTQYGNFISSDYLLTRLGLNPDALQKRLGDGFYEQQVVRQQLMHLSGKSTLGQSGSFDGEYQALLEAGATYAQDFNIAPGITLTQAQVAQLSHDMVWLEEREIEGQTVLVPVVYLAKNTPRDTGAIIAGGNSTTLQATDIRNSGIITSKGDTTLLAARDLINNSGKISGQSVTLIAGNDLNLGIATQSLTTSPGQTFTHEGLAGRVEGRTVNLMAGQDLTLAGARIEAGDATLTAGRDLTIGSQTLTTEQHLKADGSRLDRIQTVERGSTIITTAGLEYSSPSPGEMGPFTTDLPPSDNVTGGHLQLGAGRNLNIIGSRIATDGDLVGIAGEQINILASADQGIENYSARSEEVKDKHQSQYSHAQGSQLQAGGSITLGATTLVTEGAVLRAQDNITLSAETIILEASHTLDSGEGSHNKKGKGSQEQGQYQYASDQALGTIVDAGQNLVIQSTGDTLIVGGALAAGKTIQIQTGGDLALIAAQSSNFDERQSSSSSSERASSLNYSEQDIRQLLSTLTVGEGLDISVGGNFYADTGEKRADGTLNADRMTVNGIERGDSRQQVNITRTGDEADDNPAESQVKGNLAAQGIRNHSNESFDPTAANAMKGGAAALEQYFASGLVQIKNNPELSKSLEQTLANPSGETMTITDASGQVRLTVAGEAKVQAVYNTLRINETYHTEEFADQGLAQAVTLVAAIVLTVYTGGTAAGSLGGMLAGEGAAAATIGTINAGIIGMASTTFGQLAAGAEFGDALQLGLKAGTVSAVSAGIAYGVDGYVNGATNATTNTALKLPGDLTAQSGVNGVAELSTLEKLGTLKYWEQTALNATAQGVLAKVQGGKFADGFKGSVLGSLGAAGANIIGIETQGMGLTNVITHALLGCGVAAAGGKDCASGALGGAASAIVSPWLNEELMGSGLTETERNSLVAGGSVLTAILLAEALGKDKIVAGNAAANEVLNNFLSKESIAARNKALAYLRTKQGFEGWLEGWNEGDLIEQASNTAIRANDLDNRSDNLLKMFIEDKSKLSPREYAELAVYVDDYAASYGVEAAQKLVQYGPEGKVESGDYVDLLAYAQSRANLLAVHNSQAEVGMAPLMALTGSLGAILRTAGYAGASYQLGQGLGMAYDGELAGLYTTGFALLGMAGGTKMVGATSSSSSSLAGSVANWQRYLNVEQQIQATAKGTLSIGEKIGILRDNTTTKGNFGLGQSTVSEANILGQSWVGPGYKIASDGTTLVSMDGLRTYRPPSLKNSYFATTGIQANFTQLEIVQGRLKVISNGHLNITK